MYAWNNHSSAYIEEKIDILTLLRHCFINQVTKNITNRNFFFFSDTFNFFNRTRAIIKSLRGDFIINEVEYSLEVKISTDILKKDLRGTLAFMEEYSPKQSYIIAQVSSKRIIQTEFGDVQIYPWDLFLKELHRGLHF